MKSIRSKQPGKAIWTVFIIICLPVRLAFFLIYFIPSALRQHPKWTYRQALGTALMGTWLTYASIVEFRTPCSLEPGPDKDCFVAMNPAKSTLYRGILLRDKDIRPNKIGGTWHPKVYNVREDKEKIVVLHFHGGAYVLGGCRPRKDRWGPDLLAKNLSALVFCPQYRLASNPLGHFPAALQDAVTSYHYLLEIGISPSQIIISGDSAGGNLTVVLLRYLSDHKNVLPDPMAALLWSPWFDLTRTTNSLECHNGRIDYIPPHLLEWALRAYIPSSMDSKDPYLSPLHHPFSTKVPMFIQCGTVEVLYDEQVGFFLRRMGEVAGNKVEIMELQNAPHDTFLPEKSWGSQKKLRMRHLLHEILLSAKSYNFAYTSPLPPLRMRDAVFKPGVAGP